MTKYVLPVRVYLEDTDAQGVVYNASYFRFMERARTECLRACGIDHDQLREEHGIVLVLSAIEARFRRPLDSPTCCTCRRMSPRRAARACALRKSCGATTPTATSFAKAPPKWLAWTRAAASRGVYPRL